MQINRRKMIRLVNFSNGRKIANMKIDVRMLNLSLIKLFSMKDAFPKKKKLFFLGKL